MTIETFKEPLEQEKMITSIGKAYSAINTYVKEKYGIDFDHAPNDFILDKINCTSCDDGILTFTVSHQNRHIHAQCNQCDLNWIE